MEKERIKYLVDQYCARQLTASEKEELLVHLQQDEEALVELFAVFAEQEAATPYPVSMDAIRNSVDQVLNLDRMNTQATIRRIRKWSIAAAAVLLLAISGTYLWWNRQSAVPPSGTVTTLDVAPGKDGALLTLADGSRILLDTLRNGFVTNQGHSRLMITDGSLSYQPALSPNNQPVPANMGWNTMTVPAGRQFKLVLPDGTKVWLNAASFIRYPSSFQGNERLIAFNGEGYFEVAKDAKKPFRVQTPQGTVIQVLGTHFNINAYTDEQVVTTTLLEGKVRVEQQQPGGQATSITPAVLKPGQQAQSNATGMQVLDQVAIDQVIAWKNGFFDFNNKTLRQAMSQLARWYDLQVIYEEGVRDVELYGKIDRQVTLSDLLRLLENTDIRFRLEAGRKLVVFPM